MRLSVHPMSSAIKPVFLYFTCIIATKTGLIMRLAVYIYKPKVTMFRRDFKPTEV